MNRRQETNRSPMPDLFEPDGYENKKVPMLYYIAEKARAAATETYLSNQNFHRVVRMAYNERVVTAAGLAGIGRSNPGTASRWINGHSAPDSPFAQEAILKRIAELAEEQAHKLQESSVAEAKAGATTARRPAHYRKSRGPRANAG